MKLLSATAVGVSSYFLFEHYNPGTHQAGVAVGWIVFGCMSFLAAMVTK
jgi:hypothetical protein